MRILKSILIVAMLSFVAVSCSENNDIVPGEVSTNQVVNLHAKETTDRSVHPAVESGEFVKFSFKSGTIVTNDNWDIAFRGTTILVNGGVPTGKTQEPNRTGNAALTIVEGKFSKIKTVPSAAVFKQDAANALALPKSTWYTYDREDHSIDPVTGKVLIIKTNDGHYAKMEIISYYKDMDSSNSANPANSGAQYYTFNYVYNLNTGDKNFQ
ncbi:HmuY family protein [Tenacibaculum retecalamus]|uniref:HmuY family protein n=1 Tax=Tenacibaculum retecalamus TaxID=3018315 RepID=UPI0023D92D90|nr:HmuY family protein [Tenacibaculum retecalamus]WBX72034.1 HmuY family protein [Tenacibaculum retecalamus]